VLEDRELAADRLADAGNGRPHPVGRTDAHDGPIP
jgi:hypothetical protein